MLNHVLDRFAQFAKGGSSREKARHTIWQIKRRLSASNQSSSYGKLEPRQLLAATTSVPSEIVANYSADFGNAEFSYQTNIGQLHDAETTLVPISSSSDPILQLRSNGGHPGLGKLNGQSVSYDRFAIVSYEVQTSGYYEITDSFLALTNQRSNGVEFRVFVNNEQAIYSNVAQDNGRFYFDTRIGFVAKGEQIHVAFGADSDAVYDNFNADFSITRFAGREQLVGNYRTDFDRANNTNRTNWRYLWNAPANSNHSTGSIDDPASFESLRLTANQKRRPLNAGAAVNLSAGHLNLSRTGGHPGQGYATNSQSQDRYAIAAFDIEHSGFYAITDSFLNLLANTDDGLEVVVSTSANDRSFRTTFTANQSGQDFDVSLGNLSKGDTVFVAFGARGNHVRDSFKTDFSIIRILPREAPLRSISVADQNVIYAADFGAVANDRIDDYDAITNAIAAAVKIEGPVKLQFAPGIYNIDQRNVSRTALFVINQRDDFVLAGHGAKFFISNPATSFLHVFDSERVVLQDFEVDYVERYSESATPANDGYRAITFSQGIIESVDAIGNSIVLRVDPAVSVEPNEEFFDSGTNPRGTGYAIDRDVVGRLKAGSKLRYLPIYGKQFPASNRYKIYLIDAEGLEAGDRFVLQRRGQHNVIGIFRDSNQVTLSNVVASSAPATFVSATRSSHINILNSHAKIKAGRYKGVNADAIHIQDNRENVWVEDSTFSGVGDDVSNLYSLPSTIVKINAPNQLDLATVNFSRIASSYDQRYQPGDKVLFYDPIQGTAMREARVVSSETIRGDANANFQFVNRVTFDQPIGGAVVANGNDGTVLRYRNDIQVFNRDLSKNGLIQNSGLGNSRRYGTFLMAENVQIVDSVYSGFQDSAIAAHNQTSWPLGNIPRDILVQNNDFNINGFGEEYLSDVNIRAVVSFKLDRYRDLVVQGHSHLISNLTIANNRFRTWGKTALSVRNAQNVSVTDNEFYFGVQGNGSEAKYAIEVAFTTNARVNKSKMLGTKETNSENFINDFGNIDAIFESATIL